MEGPISKFMHVQQPESYWHQATSTSAFKSPDLIELNSDSERNARHVEPLNYSSSQEEVETEDDCGDAPESTHVKEVLAGPYDLTNNDEESCHLLQTEDDSESSDSEHAGNTSSGSCSSRSSSSNGGTISDGEGNEDQRGSRVRQGSMENYWDMSSEQEKYYTEQFLTLQPDLSGLVSGAVAKGFFEKSKLPHSELREIWQLADVTRDGCLDFNEFKMAMHLVVLRRHSLPIPSHFYNRQPDFSLSQSNPNPTIFKIGGKVLKNVTHNAPKIDGSIAIGASQPSPLVTCRKSTSGSDSKPQVSQHKRPSKEWTTFENEPVNFSSTCDTSGLVAPVPVRLKTPEDKLIVNSTSNASASKTQQLQLKAIQRPKLSGHHPKVSTGTIAPPPPPRRKTHVRSSSLDLNRLNISSDIQSQSNNVAGRSDVTSRSFLSPSHHGGAFSVYSRKSLVTFERDKGIMQYRKPQPPKSATIHEPPNIPLHQPSSITSDSSTLQLQEEVADLKTENSLLSRISTQLLDQLSGLQVRRQVLGYKIHQLHGNLS